MDRIIDWLVDKDILGYYMGDNIFWVRIFGYGLSGKNLKHHPKLFSERNGKRKGKEIRSWLFHFLTP